MQWLRRFIRSRTQPIPEPKAASWKKKLSVAYMLLAWNAFGFVCYMMYTGRADWAKYYGYETSEEPPGKYWARNLGRGESKIIRISGFRKTGEEMYRSKKETNDEVLQSTDDDVPQSS